MPFPRIHSKTLFHFTNQSGLIGILQSNFQANFVKEKLLMKKGQSWDCLIPMISFCDIPLHLVSDHINQYGKYGIGLSREWAIKSRLNPVFYYQTKSILFKEFDSMMEIQHKDFIGLQKIKTENGQGITIPSIRNVYMKSRYILQYYKPWYGYDFKMKKERYFYDEREWRYVPVAKNRIESIYTDKDDFMSMKDEYYKLLKAPILKFKPQNVNYIILHKEAERYEVIQKIRDIKNKYDPCDVETLISKIITVEQIEDDI